MSRVLLADDSAHAQRMGVRILREEGFEVVSVTDGETALIRLADADPDLVLVDVFLPGKSGLELCRFVKENPRHKHARVVLTAGILDSFDEAEAKNAGCDAIIRKPFEASAVVKAVKPLIEEAQAARTNAPAKASDPEIAPEAPPPAPAPKPKRAEAKPAHEPKVVDAERVRAAVTVALDAAFPSLVDELTERVLAALRR
ncbi:MAG TPA: response regulator [Bryobacteraceae bacterium]|jgi:CheY-like chemotaxis protein|nr:response regulator [Bryobacteraceae bacterium]